MSTLSPISHLPVTMPPADQQIEQRANNPVAAVSARVDAIRGCILTITVCVGKFLYDNKVGGFLVEHAVAFYAYAQYAPKTLWEQYFYANAAHEATAKILNMELLGFRPASIATVGLACLGSYVVLKVSVFTYNFFAEKGQNINVSISAFVVANCKFINPFSTPILIPQQ